jgi:hypothetical protein
VATRWTAILDARKGREDWYQSGLSVPVKEVSRLVAFCRSSVSLNSVSLCSDSYTLEHASAFEGFWKGCARLERDGTSSGQMKGDHASSVLARFLSIGNNNLLTTVYKRVALAQGWNERKPDVGPYCQWRIPNHKTKSFLFWGKPHKCFRENIPKHELNNYKKNMN